MSVIWTSSPGRRTTHSVPTEPGGIGRDRDRKFGLGDPDRFRGNDPRGPGPTGRFSPPAGGHPLDRERRDRQRTVPIDVQPEERLVVLDALAGEELVDVDVEP